MAKVCNHGWVFEFPGFSNLSPYSGLSVGMIIRNTQAMFLNAWATVLGFNFSDFGFLSLGPDFGQSIRVIIHNAQAVLFNALVGSSGAQLWPYLFLHFRSTWWSDCWWVFAFSFLCLSGLFPQLPILVYSLF